MALAQTVCYILVCNRSASYLGSDGPLSGKIRLMLATG